MGSFHGLGVIICLLAWLFQVLCLFCTKLSRATQNLTCRLEQLGRLSQCYSFNLVLICSHAKSCSQL